jgi:hypothetical protein
MFGLSGITALVYQVAWQRILALHSGVGIYSISMIVAAFLAGLAIGSYTGGKLSLRVSPATSLRVFALIEIGIGLFALISPLIYYELLYMRFPGLYASIGSAAVVHLVSLIVPTTLMGMSSPFLVHAAIRDTGGAFRDISDLYGINVVGAGIGASLAPWVLIRTFGIDGAVRLSAAENILVGLTALWIWRGLSSRKAESGQRVQASIPVNHHAEPTHGSGRRFGLWLALNTLSGLIALSLEIVWFRVIDVGIKSTAFTFGSVLAVFLIGLASGSLVVAVVGHPVRRPLDGFLTCQTALLIYTGAAVVFLVWAPPDLPGFRWFWDAIPILLCYVVFPSFSTDPRRS